MHGRYQAKEVFQNQKKKFLLRKVGLTLVIGGQGEVRKVVKQHAGHLKKMEKKKNAAENVYKMDAGQSVNAQLSLKSSKENNEKQYAPPGYEIKGRGHLIIHL